MRRWMRRAGIALFWLAVWQIAAIAVQRVLQNSFVLVGPIPALQALLTHLPTAAFWLAVGRSFVHILAGFLAAFAIGVLLGALAYRVPLLGEVLAPIVTLTKAVPVVSFVILALIWIGSARLSVLVSFLIVFPVLYSNTLAGFRSTDSKLLEMAQVFRVPWAQQLWQIYRPAVLPYLISGCRAALGMSWKAGIAAELIGVPAGTIGEQLYLAKIYLSTAELFAWTFVIVVLSVLFERAFLALLRLTGRCTP